MLLIVKAPQEIARTAKLRRRVPLLYGPCVRWHCYNPQPDNRLL